MSAWKELKAKGDADDVKLSPIELAIYNLWYETNGFEHDAEKAAAELAAKDAAIEAAREALNTISPDGWMQYLGEEECVTQCDGTPETGHAAGCKWVDAFSKLDGAK